MSAGPAPVRLALGAAVTALLVVLLGFLARSPLAGWNADQAAVRLTWRLRGEEVVECRRPTEAELADLPAHMRNPEACVGEIPPFDLAVSVDGETRIARTVHPSGARGDRPLYVYDELWLTPGRHELTVRFARADGLEAGGSGPTALQLESTVELAPGQVLLVTRDGGGALEVRRPER